MPALVDAHDSSRGYRRGSTFTADNYTAETTLLDEFGSLASYIRRRRRARSGHRPWRIAVSRSPGGPFRQRGISQRRRRLRDAECRTRACRCATRPTASQPRPRRSARGVQEKLAASRPDLIKIWVDNRNGTVEKLRPDLYRAIIDEAHKHGLRVMAHIAALEDAKDLLRAGIDGFAHVVRDKDIDQELLAMLRQRPNVFFVATLWGERNAIYGTKPSWLGDRLLLRTFSEAETSALAAGFSTQGPRAPSVYCATSPRSAAVASHSGSAPIPAASAAADISASARSSSWSCW